jgi:hypothetical protein
MRGSFASLKDDGEKQATATAEAKATAKSGASLLGGEDFFFQALFFEEVGVVAFVGEEFVVGA